MKLNNAKQHWQQPQQSKQQQHRPSKPYLGRCQICSVYGHNARRCPQLQQSVANQNLAATMNPPWQPMSQWQPRANMAYNSTYSPESWLFDSGATHHLTSDLHNLPLHQPYMGGDEVVVGNGSSLPIMHTGSMILPYATTRSLKLTDVLCVPNIQRNLISVHRLCNANRVSIEFFPSSFQVKDLATGAPMLQG